MTQVRSLLARGAYVEVPAKAPPAPAIDPFKVQLEGAVGTLREEMNTSLEALSTELQKARAGAELSSEWIRVANEKAAEARVETQQAYAAIVSMGEQMDQLRQANTALMQALDAERQATAGMEQRLVLTLGTLINKAAAGSPAPPPGPPVKAPTYRMRVTARDANNRPTDIILTPEAP